MSTLRVNNITDTTGGSANLSVPGTAKAWVNFNGSGTTGTNQTVRASLNISSIGKTAAGNYVCNFITAMPDINYSVVATARFDTTYIGNFAWEDSRLSARTTSSFSIAVVYSSYADTNQLCIAVHR